MNPGELRHKITIQKNTSQTQTENWVDYKTIWASKEPLLGREYFAAEQAQSEVEVKFRARYTPGIENFMRVVHGTEKYLILSGININSLNRELLMYCKKVE